MKQNFTVRQGALDGIEAFLAVAEHKNFRRAAAELHVTPSAISQAVRALEARVGAALFVRTTRSVGLTEAGERFIARAQPAFAELIEAAAAARHIGEQPAGLLRLTVPRGIVPLVLRPLIAGFCRAYPDVELELSVNEQLVDLAAGNFDAGIRMGQFLEADMVAARLVPPFRFSVVASPKYLKRQTAPKRAEDLRAHACARMRRTDGSLAPWRLIVNGQEIEAQVGGPFIANDFPTVLMAAEEGVALAQVPEPIAAEALRKRRLVTVLDDCAPQVPGVFLYYPDRRQILPKLRAFIDYARANPVSLP
ncbi:MAG: LysR family transcriptional regulator [Rhodospirillales bacterium]|nr:LysR family transcriptional regulator [Rhodospirillales bacterium]